MKKILIVLLSLLCFNNSYSEEFPDEMKSIFGIGAKKLSKNFVCKNMEDTKDKIRFSYKKFKTSNGEIFFRLQYDDEEKSFYFPLSILTKYKNLKHKNLKKNEVFVGYFFYGKHENENLFLRYVFVNPKDANRPYFYIEETYILSDEEQNAYNNLSDKATTTRSSIRVKAFSLTKLFPITSMII